MGIAQYSGRLKRTNKKSDSIGPEQGRIWNSEPNSILVQVNMDEKDVGPDQFVTVERGFMCSLSLKSIALFYVAGLSCASTFGQTAVDTIKSRLVNQPVTVKIEGLRVSHSVLFKSVDIRIQDGVIQKRMFSPNGNTDEVLNPGDKVRVTKVEAASDKKNDFLRLTIAAADGPTVPVAFVFSKGSLATQDESQLEQVIGSVFDLYAGGAGNGPVMSAIPVPPVPADQPMAPIPPPATPSETDNTRAPVGPTWKAVPSKNGQEVMVLGDETSGVHKSAAVLGVMCSVGAGQKFVKQNQVPSPVSLELRVRQSEVTLDRSLMYCDPYMNDGTILIDDKSSTVPMCNSTKDSLAGLWTFQYFPSQVLLKKIAASPAKPLTLEFGDGKSDGIIARFQLPSDG